MKKIGVLLPAMRMGGAEKIFLNFLDDLRKYYEVTVILNKIEGELLPELPDNVSIVELEVLDFKSLVKYNLKKFRIYNLLFDSYYFLKVKCNVDTEQDYRCLIRQMPKCEEYFDAVIAYVGNVSTQIFNLENRFNAGVKIAWIHGETNELKNINMYNKIFSSFDKIYTVSGVSKEHFVSKFSACKSKTEIYYNRIKADVILAKSRERIKVCEDAFNIVTVGRLSPEKGQLMIPGIVENIGSQISNLKWYVVGDGPDFARLSKEICKRKLQERIILTGNQMNPYTYMGMCDLYVQPSYEEGYSTTICEACILGKPVVGTNTSGGIREQIEDKKTGFIVSPTVQELTEIICWAYQHRMDLEKMGILNSEKDFAHITEINKLVDFVGV